MANGETQEALDKKLATLREMAEVQRQLNEEEAARLINARATFEVMSQQHEQQKKHLEDLRAAKEGADEAGLSEAKQEALDREIASLEASTAYYNENKDAIAAAMQATADNAQQAHEAIMLMSAKGEKNLEELSANTRERSASMTESVMAITEGGLEGMGQVLSAVYNNPELAAGMAFPKMINGLSAYRQAIMAMPAEFDTQFSQVIKDTGISSRKLGDSFTYMLDPLFAQRDAGLFRGMAEDAKPLANIGLTAKDINKSMTELLTTTSFFRPNYIEANEEQAAFIGNLTAGMAKMGVKTSTTAKNLDRMVKAIKLTPKEAATSTKSLLSIADSLGMSMGQVATNFDSVGDDMVMFGDQAVEVFGKLQAQAIATGVEVGKLSKYAQSLDTFQGAAKAAQGLNAVLGGTFLSVTDLVHADFPDKITMIQDAMANAGVEFETADRRMKQVIMNAAGFKSLDEAARVLGNMDEAEASLDALDTAAMSQEDIKVRINEGMTAAEQMTKTLSSLGGGVSKFTKRIKVASAAASGTMLNMFTQMQEKTGDSEVSLMGIVAALKGLEVLGEGAGKGALAVAGGLGKMAMNGKNASSALKALAKEYPKLAAALGVGAAAAASPVAYQMGEGVFKEETGQPGGDPAAVTISNKVDELLKAMGEMSEVPVSINVETTIDGEKVGEAAADTVIDVMGRKVRPGR